MNQVMTLASAVPYAYHVPVRLSLLYQGARMRVFLTAKKLYAIHKF